MRRLITFVIILVSVRGIIYAQADCKASKFQRGDVVVVNPNAVRNARMVMHGGGWNMTDRSDGQPKRHLIPARSG